MSAHRDPEDLFAPLSDLDATMHLNFFAPYFVETESALGQMDNFTEFLRVL